LNPVFELVIADVGTADHGIAGYAGGGFRL